jgi:hypothetical protein
VTLVPSSDPEEGFTVTCDACGTPVTVKTPFHEVAAEALAKNNWKTRRINRDGRGVRFVHYCPVCKIPSDLNKPFKDW